MVEILVSAYRDLHCTRCLFESKNVLTEYQRYPACAKCGAPMAYTPNIFATDVRGYVHTSIALDDETGHPLTYTSTRELAKKMRKMNYEPCGDRVHGARRAFGERDAETPPPRKNYRAKVEIHAD